LNQGTFNPLSSPQKTYGRLSRPSQFLDFEEQFTGETQPAKKRRIGNEHRHSISVYDDGEAEEIRSINQTSRPVSRRSAGSGSWSLPGPKDNRSEFDRAYALANPRRKKGRISNSNGASGFINGGAQSSAILVDDDDVPDHGVDPRQLQFQGFQQGAVVASVRPGRQQVPETISKHFTPKMNHSTLPSGAPTQRASRRSDNLRDEFTRGPLSASAARGSKPGLKTWPLRWARAHDFEGTEEDLFLRSRTIGQYCLTGSDPNEVRYGFSFKKINKAESDHRSRIRLSGSTNAATNVQYMVDLEFRDKLDFFEVELISSITQRALMTRTE